MTQLVRRWRRNPAQLVPARVMLFLIGMNDRGIIVRLGTAASLSHPESVSGAALSPDEQTLATGDWAGVLRLWRMSDHQLVGQFSACDGPITALAFFPSGRHLVVASRDGSVTVLDTSGTSYWRHQHGDQWCNDVAVGPAGDIVVSVGHDCTIRVFDAGSGHEAFELNRSSEVVSVALSPRGDIVAAAELDGVISFWTTEIMTLLDTELRHPGGAAFDAIAFSPDGTRLVAGDRWGAAALWDVRGMEPYAGELRERAPVQQLDFADQIQAVAFAPSGGHIALGTREGALGVWEPGTGELERLDGHHGWIRSLVWQSDHHLISAAFDNAVSVWDVESGQRLNEGSAHTGGVSCAAWGLGIATGGGDKTVRLWNADSGEPIDCFVGHADGISDMAWIQQTRLVVADRAPQLRVYEPSMGGGEFFGDDSPMASGMDHAIAALGDSGLVVSGSTRSVWDLRRGRGQQVRHLPGFSEPSDTFNAIVATPDGELLIAGRNIMPFAGNPPRWAIWSRPFEDEPWLPGWEDSVACMALSPDGQLLASGGLGDTWIRVRRVGPAHGIWMIEQRLTEHTDSVVALGYSPDGALLASVDSGHTLHVHDAHSGEIRATRDGVSGPLAFSPDGTRLLTGAGDGTLLIWSLHAILQ